MKNALALLIVVALAGGVASPDAHESFRIIGTITKVTDRDMHVKNKDSKTFALGLTKRTIVTRDKAKGELALSGLKVGQSVVVDAYGDNESDLEALEIRIVPAFGSKPPK